MNNTWLKEFHFRHQENEATAILVFIPDIIYANNGSGYLSLDWDNILPKVTPCDTKLLEFQHGIRLTESFRWHELLMSGHTLLELLFDYHSSIQDNPSPLIFVCQRLGGIILKEALNRAREQSHRFRALLNSFSGIIFLGTPHLERSDDDTWRRFATVLRPHLKTVHKKTISKEDLSDLSISALRFEELRLGIPILSAYDTAASLLRGSFIWPRRTAILVDRNFSRTNAPLEDLVPMSAEPEKILDTKLETEFQTRIRDFIQTIMQTAPGKIREYFQKQRSAGVDIPRTAASMNVHSYVRFLRQSVSSKSNKSAQSGSLLPPSQLSPEPSPPQLTPSSSNSMPSSRIQTGSSFEMIPAVPHFATARRANLPCYMIKPHTINKEFFPRDELMAQIEAALLPPEPCSLERRTDLRTFVLYGMGGVGKTELAIEFVFRNQHRYDAIFVLHADRAARLHDEFNQIAVKLGIKGDEEQSDPYNTLEAVKDWLENPIKGSAMSSQGDDRYSSYSGSSRANWLMVFDNADNPSVLLDHFWPSDGYGSVLVTSRDPMANTQFFFGDAGAKVEPLPPNECAAFLKQLTGNTDQGGDEDAALAISRRLDGLPLAIVQISALIRRRNLMVREFWELYQHETDLHGIQKLQVGAHKGYKHTLASVWALGSLNPTSLSLLNVISFLDPENIQEEILTSAVNFRGNPDYPRTKSEYHAHLEHLLSSSIVSRNAIQREIRVHRLVQDVARARAAETDGLLELCFDMAVQLVSSVWPFILRGGVGRAHKVDRWERCGKLFIHIVQLAHHYEELRRRVEGLTPRVQFADLLNEAAWYQFERSNSKDAAPLLNLAVSICEGSEEDTVELEAFIHGTFTWISSLEGDTKKCLHHAKIRLDLEEQRYAKTKTKTANLAAAYNDLGACFAMNKLYSKAYPLLERSKTEREALPGFKKEHLYSPFRHLALVYYHERAYEKAADLLHEALKVREAALGPNDTQSVRTGTLLYGLGNVYDRKGFVDDSFAWHSRALLQFRSTGGADHFYTGFACYRVAEHHVRLQEFHIARNLIEQALRIFQHRIAYRQEAARGNFLYAQVLQLLGEDEKADNALEASIKAFNELSPGPPRTAQTLTAEDFDSIGSYEF